MRNTKIILFIIAFLVNNIHCLNRFYQTWMKDMSDKSSFYGFDLYSKTIFDVIFPGSHKSGMNSITTVTPSTDSFANTVNALSDDNKILWSERHKNSILNQLILGSRFIDLQLKYQGTDQFYAYNGILGTNIADIIADINQFLNTFGSGMYVYIFYR